MRVKIGDKWYDSATLPILVEFLPEEADKVRNMAENNCFCSYPAGTDVEFLARWATTKRVIGRRAPGKVHGRILELNGGGNG